MADRPKDHVYHLHLPPRDVRTRDGIRTLPAVRVEVEISGWAVQALAERSQRNKTRRARSGPATARAYLAENP